ncbi:MAG: hypothetical protein WDA00_00830 [Eubacteriales bacterium]
MGFGLLFLGYLFFLNLFNNYLLLPACVLLFWALCKLTPINRPFAWAKYVLVPLGALGILAPLSALLSVRGGRAFDERLNSGLSIAALLLMLLFHWLLFEGIQRVAAETNLPQIRLRALRCRLLSALYFVCAVFLNLNYSEAQLPVVAKISLVILLYGFFVMLSNLRLIYNCYMWICMPEDIEMTPRVSRQNRRPK